MSDNHVVSLRDYFASLMQQYKEAHAREHVLIAEGVERTRVAMGRRLDAMNELRAQILEERGGLATKEWVTAKVVDIENSLDAHEATSIAVREEAVRARTTANRAVIGIVVTAVTSIAVALIALFT